MFDQLSHAYDQMQPGDKMVMHFHKSPKPTTTYQMPAGSPGVAGGDSGGGMSAGGAGLPRDGGMSQGFMAPQSAAGILPGAVIPDPGAAAAGGSDPLMERQALMAALARMRGGL
jgi:hypothetical protein